jgi:subtilase family serine protease
VVADIVPGCPVLGTTALPTGGSGIIAIVNAFDYPAARHDLNVFSRRFGVPLCNAANPCFSTVFASGTRPPVDSLWALNASNAIEYAHAFAPGAQVLLVEAATASLTDLMTGVAVANQFIAAAGGKGFVLLPWGLFEFQNETDMDAAFTQPGVIYIAGNEGGLKMVEYPASSPNVIAVGGTSFVRDGQGNLTGETSTTFWAGGKSRFEMRPSYQDQDMVQRRVGISRGVPDLAFAGDAAQSPELYYDSIDFDGFVGWQYTGNLNFGDAFWAAVIDLAGSSAGTTQQELTILYSHAGDAAIFHDITTGNAMGVPAKHGWDFVTGLGSDVGLLGK